LGNGALALAERVDPELRGPNQQQWWQRLDTEHDNVRAALAWSLSESNDAEVGLRLVGFIWWFWFVRGHWTEGRRWHDTALAREAQGSPLSVAKALHGAAYFAWRQHDLERAQMLAERSLAIGRNLEHSEIVIWSLFDLGIIAVIQGDSARAETIFREATALARACGHRWFLGLLLSQQGVLARNAHDYEGARQLHAEALSLARAVGDTCLKAYQLRNLGMDSLRQGRPDESMTYFVEGLHLGQDIAARWILEECLEGLAGVAGMCGQDKRAAMLLGAVEAQRKVLGHMRTGVDQADFDYRVAWVRARLGEEPFQVAWAAGRAMTLDAAIECALEVPADDALRSTVASSEASPVVFP